MTAAGSREFGRFTRLTHVDDVNLEPRGLARRVLQRARRLYPELTVAGFGSSGEFLVGFGARSSIRIPAAHPDPWSEIQRYMDAERGSRILGYLGFDMNAGRAPDLATAPVPGALLLVPEAVFVFERGSVARAEGGAAEWDGFVREVVEGAVEADDVGTRVDLCAWDTEPSGPFREQVEQVKTWIERGQGRRLTIARRIDLPSNLDLTSPLDAPMHQDIDRSFYIRDQGLELGGTSPELLASTEGARLTTFKLSGTYRRSPDAASDRALSEHFCSDPKIRDEHANSVDSMRRALEPLGRVVAAPPAVHDLSNLRHMLTRFDVDVDAQHAPSECLRCVYSSGADPSQAGVEFLAAMGAVARGPYYGLLGTVAPDGGMCFSQVLRAVFRDASGCHTHVGAAITALSLAADEYEETRLKLGNIFVREARQSG